MKKILGLLFISLLLLSYISRAQENAGKISGRIEEGENKPLEAATVSLLNASDSSVVKVSATNKEGAFRFENLAHGKFIVLASSVGYGKTYSQVLELTSAKNSVSLKSILLTRETGNLKEVAVVGKKAFVEQKADRMIVNVDASPSSAGSTAMDILEKSPGVTVDKDGNISLKGKQNVMVMIDNKPTYMTSTQLASYLKGLPASALDIVEIMTNPSAKYDAAGNSGIINIKTKKNKVKGFNGSLTLTHTQGEYPKPSGSINLNYRTGKVNIFLNGGLSQWEGYQTLEINRKYLNVSDHQVNSIFSQRTHMHFRNPEKNLKLGLDYYLNNKTTIGFVVSGFQNNEHMNSTSNILLKDPSNAVDSTVYATSVSNGNWKNGSVNLNFRRQFDSTGTELTADADYVTYRSGNDQVFPNTTYYPDGTEKSFTLLTGNLPSNIDIYSFKSDFTKPFKKEFKLEAGFKTSYVSTDNNANYFNVVNNVKYVDTGKTNRFAYHEYINAAYVNLNKQYKKWGFQAGLRYENTTYDGHQFGNDASVVRQDSSFKRSYGSLFPTVYISYNANAKNTFSVNYGRRIDRPSYQDLNPFLFFLDQYTYQAGNPYLQPQFTHNVELSHTYNGFLTTTLNYSNTRNFMTETFEQRDHATIVRNGNIGHRENAGIAVSAQIKATKWWTAILYTNYNYSKFNGLVNGENINISAGNFLANVNNQFRFTKGWSAELSGWYRSKGVEGQIAIDPMGQVSAAISKQIMKEKASLKLGIRDMFYTQVVTGHISFQQTEASFKNSRDSRQLSLTFSYRFGKPINGQRHRNTGGAGDEQNRVKVGGNN